MWNVFGNGTGSGGEEVFRQETKKYQNEGFPSELRVVEHRRFELLTSSLRTKRSTN